MRVPVISTLTVASRHALNLFRDLIYNLYHDSRLCRNHAFDRFSQSFLEEQ